jgi:WD40 repeat protein
MIRMSLNRLGLLRRGMAVCLGLALLISLVRAVEPFRGSPDAAAENQPFAARQGLTLVAVSPDGRTLAGVSPAGRIELRDLAGGRAPKNLPGRTGVRATGIAFNPGGDILAGSGEDGRIDLWELKTGRIRLTLPGHDGAPIDSLAFSPGGTVLATSAADRRVKLWDVAGGEERHILAGHDGAAVLALAFSPDGHTLATSADNGQAKLWDVLSGREAAVLGGLNATRNNIDFSIDGALFAAVGQDGRVRLWETASGREREPLPQNPDNARYLAVAFSPDGASLAGFGADHPVRVWDLATGQVRHTLADADGARLTAAAFDPASGLLATGDDRPRIVLWDTAAGTAKSVLAVRGEPVGALAFGPDGKTLVSQGLAGQITVWKLPEGTARLDLPGAALAAAAVAAEAPASPAAAAGEANASPSPSGRPAPAAVQAVAQAAAQVVQPVLQLRNRPAQHDWRGVAALAVSPDGSLLGIAGKSGNLRILRANGAERFELKSHHGRDVAAVGFTADGKRLVSAGRDTEIEVWDVVTGKQERTLHGSEQPLRAVAVAADGKVATGGEETRIMLWNGAGKLSRILNGHQDFVNGLAFSPDGGYLASCGADTRVILWDLGTGKSVRTFPGGAELNAVVFSPDGKLLATGGADSRVVLWEAASGRQLQVFSGHNGAVRSLAFSRDGRRLASGGEDARTLVWDLASRKLYKALAGQSVVNAVAFGQGGRLFSADESRLVIEWNADTGGKSNTTTVPVPVPGRDGAALLAPPAVGSGPAILGRILDWLIPAASAAVPPPPGGPVLIVANGTPGTVGNPNFSGYYAEILRNEGFNEFDVANLSTVSSGTLGNYDLVILVPTPLTSGQTTMFTDWVNAGGNLIAMRPDKQLAGLLGLTDAGSTLSEAYLAVDTSASPGNGIVSQPMQFHGTADRYALSGATAVATLYSNATTATSNPAVTLRNAGSGQAAAFTYDLAGSIVYQRQGNPAWAAQERDGFSPIRSDDKFYGAASGDVQPDWVDLQNLVAVPQADEQQRLLGNLILKMNLAKKPLPRFWYFPFRKKAVVIMTGDDHGNNGTEGRFNQFKALSPPGCSVADWECVRGTSYLFPNTPLTNAKAVAFNAEGFEVGLHVNTNCADFTEASLETIYVQQIADLHAAFPGIPAPVTERHHCIAWSDWVSGAKVQLAHGIRLDTSYYFWPPSWVQNRPGFFTGSAMPMRFADLDGSLVDVYNVVSHMTDESGQTYPFTVDTLLDRAVGSQGFYGAYTLNAHTDLAEIPESDTAVASAQARNVPVVSGAQMLTWLDGRGSSEFDSLAWNGSALSFTVVPASGANGLQAMVPAFSSAGVLTGITGPGGAVAYAIDTVKGVDYAFFPAAAGAYTATYAADTTPPTVSARSPAAGATGVGQGTAVTATFSEAMNPATVTTASFLLQGPGGAPVAAAVAYDGDTRTATLTPNGSLAATTTYTATVKGGAGGVKDIAGNALAADQVWTFTTAAAPCSAAPCSAWPGSAVPANPSVNDPNAVELGVKFTVDVDGYITGVRFYKGSGNTGTHVGHLWSSGGQQLAAATFADETASGWQQVDFAAPVAVTAGTVYIASYYAPNGNYAASSNPEFGISGVDAPPIHLLRSGVSGGNGVYVYGAGGGFPTSTYNATNYWVDVVFSTQPAPAGLAVTTASLPGGTVGAAYSATLAATGGTPPYNWSITTGALPAGLSLNAATGAVTGTPTAAGTANFTVQVADSASPTPATATHPLSIAVAAAQTSVTIWPAATVPGTVDGGADSPVEVGVKFRSDVGGFITGIRFYKASTNTGTHVGNLWSSGGALLATVTFSGETASGWQQANFATPVAITANTVYVASYHTNVGHYGDDQNYFAAGGVDNPPLHALQDGVAGPNSVYAYGSGSSFPTETYRSTNYWVDVVFTPGS